MIHEIDSSDWPAFCQRVSEQRTGATVKLEVVESSGVKSERVANATFQGMSFDSTNPCSDVITLRLRGEREIVYEIIDPIQILLHGSKASADYNSIQIDAESGVSFITIHPPIHSEMFKGLKTSSHAA
jgi:hypothetical protein